MNDLIRTRSVEFFETRFRKQVRESEYVLNPFETLAAEHLKGDVLDLGAGLGNLSLEAGRRGHRVVAVDASPTAVSRINADARREGLRVEADRMSNVAERCVGGWVGRRSGRFTHHFTYALRIC